MKKIFLAIIVAAMLLSLTACGSENTASAGEQTVKFDDGSVFVGEVKDGKPNGQGTMTDALGNEWTGNFVDGVLQGFGTYVGYDLVEYEGMFVDGQFNGMGHRIDANGNDYQGNFVDGMANGFGRIEWSTGCIYEGGMKDDMMDGNGWMTWPVGDAYFGEWITGSPNGFGCKVYYDPAIPSCILGDYTTYNKYVGQMVNNMPQGYGIMYFQGSGGIYIGNWEDGVRNDLHGVYYFEPGIDMVKFEGAFSKDKNAGWIWGDGTMWYSDGRVVTGTWEGTECVNVVSDSAA